jgi:hypothetical protein
MPDDGLRPRSWDERESTKESGIRLVFVNEQRNYRWVIGNLHRLPPDQVVANFWMLVILYPPNRDCFPHL